MGAADVRHGDQGRGGRGRGKKTSSRNSARAHGLSLRTRSRMHLVIVHAPDVSCGSAAYATFAALVSGIWTRIMVGWAKVPPAVSIGGRRPLFGQETVGGTVPTRTLRFAHPTRSPAIRRGAR